jgi:hypothetical protein
MADPTEEQLKEAARKALAAGDTAAAKRLVDAARKAGATQPAAGPFSLGGGPQVSAGPFSVQSAPAIPKWQQAPEVPKWQKAPLVEVSGKSSPAEILAKSKALYDSGDVEGAKRLARIAKDRKDSASSENAPGAEPAMQTFEIQGPDGKLYEVQAPDQEAAIAGFESFSGLPSAGGKSTGTNPDAASGKTVLNIGGRRVNVSDKFLSMSPEEQSKTVDEIARSMGMLSPTGSTVPHLPDTPTPATRAQWAELTGAGHSGTPPDEGVPAPGLMPFKMSAETASIIPVPPSTAAGVRNPETGIMGGIGRYTPGRLTMDKALASLSETWKNPPPPISQSRSAIVGGAQGATFGFADEIVGGLLALHPRIDYGTARDYLRAEVDDAREYFPKTTLAGEIGGSIAVPGKAAASFVNKGKDTVGRMVRGAMAGGTSGALAGFGGGEGGAEERAWNALESGTLGALGGGALVGLGQGFNKLLGMASKRPELAEVAPTLQGLRDDAAKLYSEARASGALMPAEGFKSMVAGIQTALKDGGFDNDLHPRLTAVLKRLMADEGDKSLADIEILRRVAGNAAESFSPDERRLAGVVVDKIDDGIDGLDAGGEAMKAARETWGRLRRMEAVETAIERAGLASTNFATALQNEFRALVKNTRKMRGFSAGEKEAIAKVARGGPVSAGLKTLGATLSPSRPLGAMVAGGTTMGFGPSALALPATGMLANRIAEALAKRSGRKVAESVGSSDARRAIVEALARKSNPMGATVPAAGLLGSVLGER